MTSPMAGTFPNGVAADSGESIGWDDAVFSSSGDLQFQLPAFLGPSSQAAPGGGVETAPNRSVGDWNGAAFESMGDGMLSLGDEGPGQTWDNLPNWSSAITSPPLKLEAQPSFIPDINPIEESVTSISPSLTLDDSSNPLHLPNQPTVEQAFPNGSHLLPSGPTLGAIPPVGKTMPGLYSSTGFDVLGVLSRVVTRQNPRTVLGPVDFSCSFLVVDVRKYDSPIVYASPTFSELTGYEAKEIIGKNCRFLQAPNGEVQKGSRRKFTDNIAVAHLQRQLAQGKECQASLINYKKGGVPFINLVTVVPIPWDTEEIMFHVGFQVDLVESPNAILRNIKSGTYQVNYAVLNNPHLPMAPAGQLAHPLARLGSSALNADIIDVLGSKANIAEFSGGEDALTNEWFKMMFEHSDDFIHVLSLKGQFQYVSPSVRRVLEYDPEDLVNKFVSDICHPSDIVPVMRELKDSTQLAPDGQAARTVNFLFRVKKKASGMVWMECTGRLHVEAGKGRKAVILCGRERVVPRLDWNVIGDAGGLAPSGKEMWTTVSFEGLVLYASNSVNTLLQPKEEVIGASLLDFIPASENALPTPPSQPVSAGKTLAVNEPPHDRVRRALKAASEGHPKRSSISVRHQMISPATDSKVAQLLEVISVFYAVDDSHRVWTGESSARSSSPWDSTSSSPSGSDQTDSFDVGGGVGPSQRKVKPVSIIVQIKVLATSPLSSPLNAAEIPSSAISSADLASSILDRATIHDGDRDVNEELGTTRSSGWQYELHQLKNENRKLKDLVLKIKDARLGRPSSTGSAGSTESKSKKSLATSLPKRKRDSPLSAGGMGPPTTVPSRRSSASDSYASPHLVTASAPSSSLVSYPAADTTAASSRSYALPTYTTHPSQQVQQQTYYSPSYYSQQQQAQALQQQQHLQQHQQQSQHPPNTYASSPLSYADPSPYDLSPQPPYASQSSSSYYTSPSSSLHPSSLQQHPSQQHLHTPSAPRQQQSSASSIPTFAEYSAFIHQQQRAMMSNHAASANNYHQSADGGGGGGSY